MPKTSYNQFLEIACFNLQSCLLAQEAGADRIEFCSDYSKGGLTPNKAEILKIKEMLSIPLHIIIRPRGGNFIYNEEEIRIIEQDILFCKTHRVNGVVFGVLTQSNEVDYMVNKKLRELAEGMSTIFHRAIDECDNMNKAFETIIDLGFSHVLTSGGKGYAEENTMPLQHLQRHYGQHIRLIAGGGVRSYNIQKIQEETGCIEFHSAALINNQDITNVNEVKLMKAKIINA